MRRRRQSGPIPLVAGGSNTSTANFTLPAVGAGVSYTVNALYTPATTDNVDGAASAAPIVLQTIPSTVETVTATLSAPSYTYGSVPPTATLSFSPALPAGVTATPYIGAYPIGAAVAAGTLGSASCAAAGTYPVTVQFAPQTSACGYGFPSVTNAGSGGGAATVTENQQPLTVSFGNPVTTVYGATPDYNFSTDLNFSGTQCGDINLLNATFSTSAGGKPVLTSVLDVLPTPPATNPYTIYPTPTGAPIVSGDYLVTVKTTTETVQVAPTGVSVTAAQSAIANTTAALATATYSITVGTQVSAGKGIPQAWWP